MKIISLLLIAASIISFAFVRLNAFKSRFASLDKSLLFIQCIKCELSVEPASLEEVFGCISKRTSHVQIPFFEKISTELEQLGEKSFYQIWCENIEKFFSDLTKDELYELKSLGKYLGYSPLDVQLSYISNCEKFLSEILHREKAEFPHLCKLHIGLSFAAAAALIIVFI